MKNLIEHKKGRILFVMSVFAITAVFGSMLLNPLFADAAGNVAEILTDMIDIIGMIFTAVGIILAIYSVGTLVLAFKNDDPDSKTRASTVLVVSIVLIAFPQIVDKLNLVQYLRI